MASALALCSSALPALPLPWMWLPVMVILRAAPVPVEATTRPWPLSRSTQFRTTMSAAFST